MTGLTKGLIIKGEHCENILKGIKTWEMRSKVTNYRGEFGLIISGTKKIFGKANLVRVSDNRLKTIEHWDEMFEFHQCKEFMPQWPVPWVLQDIVRFDKPIPYKHKNGCVTWVNL